MKWLFDLPITDSDIQNNSFHEQNHQTAQLWHDFENGKHQRVPIRLNSNSKVLLLDKSLNRKGITFKDYFFNPDTMAEVQFHWELWRRFLLPGDHEHGLPKEWEIYIDFQNVYDGSWFGCPLLFLEGQVPTTQPILHDDNKNKLFDQGIPDPFQGELVELSLKYLDYYKQKCKAGWEFLGIPVKIPWKSPFGWTDGVFTIATLLRGAEALCIDLLVDPPYVHQLLDFITQALITRMKKWLNFMGIIFPMSDYWFADDAVQMLSLEQYCEFVLPYHKQIYDTFAEPNNRYIHLCGNVQHLLPTIKSKLNVRIFDTGFPIDFGKLRQELGEECLISGGPKASLFLKGCVDDLLTETKNILSSGILQGGRFILQEGNNLPPYTDLETCKQFYKYGKIWGRL